MYYLKTEESFDSAHFLKDYEGKCRNLHGHRWRVVAEIKEKELKKDTKARGMLVDFEELKGCLRGVCEELDHSLIYEKDSLLPASLAAFRAESFKTVEVGFRPTAENFARYFFERLRGEGFGVHRVEVYETPNNCAAYEE